MDNQVFLDKSTILYLYMNFFDIRILDATVYTSSGGPTFSTAISSGNEKQEVRRVNWGSPRYRYNLKYGIRNKVETDAVLNLFNLCKGKGIGFRYKDWNDFSVIKSTIGIGDGINKKFQLIKNYGVREYNFSRIISKPVNGTVLIYIDNINQAGNFSVDYSSGIILFTQPPAINSKISASFEFDVPVRFDTDSLSIMSSGKDRYQIEDLQIIEIYPN